MLGYICIGTYYGNLYKNCKHNTSIIASTVYYELTSLSCTELLQPSENWYSFHQSGSFLLDVCFDAKVIQLFFLDGGPFGVLYAKLYATQSAKINALAPLPTNQTTER